jgi:hypothetical protein
VVASGSCGARLTEPPPAPSVPLLALLQAASTTPNATAAIPDRKIFPRRMCTSLSSSSLRLVAAGSCAFTWR